MKAKLKDAIFDVVNAAVLPLLIVIISQMHPPAEASAIATLINMLACPTFLVTTSITIFALGYTLLNNLRWPLIIAAYIIGGLVASQAYTHFVDSQVSNPYVFGVWALIGSALVASFFTKLHPFFDSKLSLPGPIWLVVIIGLDALINYQVKDRLFSDGSLDWRINVVAISTGIAVGVVAFGLFRLLKAILRNSAACTLLSQLFCRYTNKPAAAYVPANETPVRPEPAISKKSPSATPTTTTSKLLSRTDLPQVKSAGKSGRSSGSSPSQGSADPANTDSTDSGSDWLQKHLSTLNK